MNTYLIIDLSYLVYGSCFGSLAWYKSNFPMDHIVMEEYEWGKDQEFIAFFKNFLVKKIMYSMEVGGIKDFQNVILAKDCKRKNIWRMEHFPAYKAHRGKEIGKPDFTSVFEFVDTKVLPNLIDKKGCVLLEHPKAEGDDLVAVTKYKLRKAIPNSRIYITSSDKDLYQLIDKNTYMINIAGEGKVVGLNEIDPVKEAFKKVLIGDKSDGIPPIHVKCGPVTAGKYFSDKALLHEKLLNPEIRKQFELNRKLILFSNMPKDIFQEISESVDEKFGLKSGEILNG